MRRAIDERDEAQPDFVPVLEGDGLRDTDSLHERPVLAPEVREEHPPVVPTQTRVAPRNGGVVDGSGQTRLASQNELGRSKPDLPRSAQEPWRRWLRRGRSAVLERVSE